VRPQLKRAILKMIYLAGGTNSSTLRAICAAMSSSRPYGRPALSQRAFLKLIPLVRGTIPSIFGGDEACYLRSNQLELAVRGQLEHIAVQVTLKGDEFVPRAREINFKIALFSCGFGVAMARS